ncbi:metallophosphoesterase family protein [Haladaptatus halobius]|uniref:metallophosphoesterase family protein n=1 Tax=Haladaptatus halobius TaxID=2884875 RepID=UPI001D09A701
MTIAIISDIHANAVALDSILTDIERDSVDQIICLGDIAGTGPQPVRTLEHLQELECPVVLGNVDETLLDPPSNDSLDEFTDADQNFAEIDAWCADQLSAAHKSFIQSFDSTLEFELPDGIRLYCYHGSPRSHSEEVHATTSEERLDELFENVDAHLLAGGHTHFPFIRRYQGMVLLNPGSVGLPYVWNRDVEGYRNPPWAEYAVITGDPKSLQVELRRCPLDVTAVVESALESDMPHARWWTEGWQPSQ